MGAEGWSVAKIVGGVLRGVNVVRGVSLRGKGVVGVETRGGAWGRG